MKLILVQSMSEAEKTAFYLAWQAFKDFINNEKDNILFAKGETKAQIWLEDESFETGSATISANVAYGNFEKQINISLSLAQEDISECKSISPNDYVFYYAFTDHKCKLIHDVEEVAISNLTEVDEILALDLATNIFQILKKLSSDIEKPIYSTLKSKALEE